MDFNVGDVVVISDGKNRAMSRIDGIRRGYLKVGYLLFDWCGNEVETHANGYKIYPVKVDNDKKEC